MIPPRARVLASVCVILLTNLTCTSRAGVEGYWKGQVSTPVGTLPIALTIAAGDTSALLDSPALGFTDAALAVKVNGDHVRLTLDSDGARGSGEATAAADSMRGTVTVGGARFPLDLRRDVKPEKNYQTEAVTVRNGDIALSGTLYLPKSDRPVPAIAFVAGLAPRSNGVHFLADLFASR